MKKVILSLAALSLMWFASCNNAPDASEADVKDAVAVNDSANASSNAYKVNVADSKIEWVGTKPVGQHNGTISLKEGNLNVEGGKLTGGSFTIDMNSIKAIDQDSTGNAKLEGHLKAGDFFETEKFPEGKFVITSVADATDSAKMKMKDATHLISGNLTLKGIEKNITFPAKVTVTDNSVEAVSELSIDRTLWNIVYNSDASLKDKFINKDINLKLNVKAAK